MFSNNLPNNFDSSDVLGWHEIVLEDGNRVVVPVR